MKKIASIITTFALAVLLFSVGNVHATSLYVGGTYNSIASFVNNQAITEGGGSISGSLLDGKNLDYLYCVDLFTTIGVNNTYDTTTVNGAASIHGNQVKNASSVAYLLGKYGMEAQGDQSQSIALQAAIWYEVNDRNSTVYRLDASKYTGTNSNVATLYNQYVTEAANNLNIGNISNFLWINPGKDATGTTIYQGLVTSAPVPEPGTMMLLGFGMLGLAIYGKRRANKEV